MIFTGLLFVVLVGFWVAGHIRGELYNVMNIAADLKSIAYHRIYYLCPNCKVTIVTEGLQIVQIGIEKNVYSDGLAHVIVPADTCIALSMINLTKTYTLCAGAVSQEYTVPPGNYYIEMMPAKPVSLQIEAMYSWLPYAILLVLFIALVILLAHTMKR